MSTEIDFVVSNACVTRQTFSAKVPITFQRRTLIIVKMNRIEAVNFRVLKNIRKTVKLSTTDIIVLINETFCIGQFSFS